jgi:hypothetical protein
VPVCQTTPSGTAAQPAVPVCQTTPSGTADWVAYTHQIAGMDSAGVLAERESASRLYASQPDDEIRMRLAYVLSRPDASFQQLTRSREILAEISAASDMAPVRDLLDREISLLIKLQRAQGRTLELQAQLEALKAIEAEMLENRQDLDKEDP